MTPRLALLLARASLRSGASTSRAATMIASPETPTVSLTTGPTLMANRSWNRAGSRWLLLCRSSARGSFWSICSMTFAVETFGGITSRMPSPRSSDHTSGMPCVAAFVIRASASLMMRRSGSVRMFAPNATTSERMTVQFSPFSGSGCPAAGLSGWPVAMLSAGPARKLAGSPLQCPYRAGSPVPRS